MKPIVRAVLAWMLLPMSLVAQALPTMNIGAANGQATIWWTNGIGYSCSLQSSTNLNDPEGWVDELKPLPTWGTTTVSLATSPKFFRLASVYPLFQFAIFYNMNLEIASGSTFNIYGPACCNQNIWEGSTALTFYSTVSAHGTNAVNIVDPFSWGYSNSAPAVFKLAGQPLNHAPQLTLPIGTNSSPGAVLSVIQLPPSPYDMGTTKAYSPSGLAYLANAVDIYITNFVWGTNAGLQLPKGTNFVAFLQNPGYGLNSLTQIPYDYFMITNGSAHVLWLTNNAPTNIITGATNIYYAGYSWATNVAFYDWREGWSTVNVKGKRVEAVQIDVTNFSIWLASSGNNGGFSWDALKTTHSGNHISSIYVHNSVPLTTSQLPAVRLVRGAQLPHPGGSTRGFTVATQFPIYVLGDYNSQNNGQSALGLGTTTNTLPAALWADSCTVLSDGWNDAYTSKLPFAGNTTVNAAMVAGIVPTNPDIYLNYSGGVENFLRLLENWNGNTLTYNGSIVALYPSQYATNYWRNPGTPGSLAYYNVPTRLWAFDLNFNNPAKLPPLTPIMQNFVAP